MTVAAAQPGQHGGGPMRTTDLVAGRFRTQLERLPEHIQAQVLSKISTLEIPSADFEALHVHPRGNLYYACDFGGTPSGGLQSRRIAGGDESPGTAEGMTGFASAVPISSPPVFHSQPGSTNILFLDFNGAVVTNTAWNSYPDFATPSWDCRPFSIDADETTFSVAEQQAIQTIWERVAEDYAPFDIDVTTEPPPIWSRYTGHVLITPGTDKNGVACPHDGAGGIAFVDVFGEPDYSYDFPGECYSPAWVLNYELAGYAEYEAEAASHEMGHNLELSHDGTKKEPYYGGHENGSIGWGPVMGTGYDRNVSQWSKGDYALSNNAEDDLAIISSQINYRPDDFSDDRLSAGLLALGATGLVYQAGVIEQSTDEDVFCFSATSGAVAIAVSPYRDSNSTTWGGNLDVVLELYDEVGLLIATNNPALETKADLSVVVNGGVYYLHIRSTGVGNPLKKPSPDGYVRYGSLGQYTITGQIPIHPDLDGDGLPNIWEWSYFGDLTNAVAAADSDGDGQSNLDERIAGFDPTNAMSVFRIEEFMLTPSNGAAVVITWSPVTGRVYNVTWSDNVVLEPFEDISGDLPYSQSSYTDTVDRVGPVHLYRVDVRLED